VKLDVFGEWLRDKGYRPASVRKAVTDIGTMVAHGPVPPESAKQRTRILDYRWAWDLYEAFADETGHERLAVARPELPERDSRVGKRLRKEPKRVLAAVSIAPDEMRRFEELVERDTTVPGIVLHVITDTGLRVSDVLRVTRATLEQGFRRTDGLTEIRVKGDKPIMISVHGAPIAWKRLFDSLHVAPATATVADRISKGSAPEAGSAAYHAVRRKLRELATEAGVTGRVHLHRLRRTMVVDMLRGGETLETAQAAVGHEDRRTTAKYGDEQRALDAAAALRRMNARRRGDPT